MLPPPPSEVGVGKGGEGEPLTLPCHPPAVTVPEMVAEGVGRVEKESPEEDVKAGVGVTRVVVVALVSTVGVPLPSRDTVGEEEMAALGVPPVLEVGLSEVPALGVGALEEVGATCVPVGVDTQLGDPAPPPEGVSVAECVGLPVPMAPLGLEERDPPPPPPPVFSDEFPTPPKPPLMVGRGEVEGVSVEGPEAEAVSVGLVGVGKEDTEEEGEMVAEGVERAEVLVVGVEPTPPPIPPPEEGEVEGVKKVAVGVGEELFRVVVEGVPVKTPLPVLARALMVGVMEKVWVGEVVLEPSPPTPPPAVRVAPNKTPRMLGVGAGVGVSIRPPPGEGVEAEVGVAAEGEGVRRGEVVPLADPVKVGVWEGPEGVGVDPSPPGVPDTHPVVEGVAPPPRGGEGELERVVKEDGEGVVDAVVTPDQEALTLGDWEEVGKSGEEVGEDVPPPTPLVAVAAKRGVKVTVVVKLAGVGLWVTMPGGEAVASRSREGVSVVEMVGVAVVEGEEVGVLPSSELPVGKGVGVFTPEGLFPAVTVREDTLENVGRALGVLKPAVVGDTAKEGDTEEDWVLLPPAREGEEEREGRVEGVSPRDSEGNTGVGVGVESLLGEGVPLEGVVSRDTVGRGEVEEVRVMGEAEEVLDSDTVRDTATVVDTLGVAPHRGEAEEEADTKSRRVTEGEEEEDVEMVEEGVESRGLPLTLPLPPAKEGEEEGEGGVEGLQLLGVGVAEGDLVREERALGVEIREGLCVPLKTVVVEGEVAREGEAQ